MTESYSILKEGPIKYNNCNGVILMKIHIDCAHPKLFVAKKMQLIEVIPLDHTRQLVKKRVGITSSAIIDYFGFSNPYK